MRSKDEEINRRDAEGAEKYRERFNHRGTEDTEKTQRVGKGRWFNRQAAKYAKFKAERINHRGTEDTEGWERERGFNRQVAKILS